MRYTKESEKFINAYEWNRELPTKTFVQLGMNKFGQLEDIEEMFNLDLKIIAKALSDGVYVKTKNGISKHFTVSLRKWQQTNTYCFYYRPYSHIWFKDYGKTWALSEEDLK